MAKTPKLNTNQIAQFVAWYKKLKPQQQVGGAMGLAMAIAVPAAAYTVAMGNFNLESDASGFRPVIRRYNQPKMTEVVKGPGYKPIQTFLPQATSRPDTSKPKNPVKPIAVGAGCVRSGCSSQLCLDITKNDSNTPNPGMTTCQWNIEYECNKYRVCQKDPTTNKCGWMVTADKQGDYNSCMSQNSAK